MNSKIRMAALLIGSLLSILTACQEKTEIASPACAELEKATDPAVRAELLKRCSRGGLGFKPSPKVLW